VDLVAFLFYGRPPGFAPHPRRTLLWLLRGISHPLSIFPAGDFVYFIFVPAVQFSSLFTFECSYCGGCCQSPEMRGLVNHRCGLVPTLWQRPVGPRMPRGIRLTCVLRGTRELRSYDSTFPCLMVPCATAPCRDKMKHDASLVSLFEFTDWRDGARSGPPSDASGLY